MSEQPQPQDTEGRKKFAGYFIPAGFLIGAGVGFALGDFLPGLLIGGGAGFLCYGVASLLIRN
jgi:hypothetical protein